MIQTNKRLVLIIGLISLFFVVIPIGIFIVMKFIPKSATQTNKTIIIDNKDTYSTGVNPAVFANISTSSYSATSLNIQNPESYYHGIIRTETFKNIPNNSVSFILDIPSLKISWAVGQALDNTGAPVSDASITCITESQAIYPLLNSCVDQSGGGLTSKQTELLKIAKILPLSGPTYNVTFTDSPDKSSYILVITYYTDTGKQDALSAIQSLNYNPSDYEITYINGI